MNITQLELYATEIAKITTKEYNFKLIQRGIDQKCLKLNKSFPDGIYFNWKKLGKHDINLKYNLLEAFQLYFRGVPFSQIEPDDPRLKIYTPDLASFKNIVLEVIIELYKFRKFDFE